MSLSSREVGRTEVFEVVTFNDVEEDKRKDKVSLM